MEDKTLERTMTTVNTDAQGRVYLPKEIRDEYGESFRLVEYQGELRLIPVAEDPVDDLRERTEAVRESDKTTQELQEEAREQLQEDAG